MNSCKECGTENPEYAKFCSECGHEITNNTTEKQKSNSKKDDKKTTREKIGDACYCIAGLIFISAVLFPPQNGNYSGPAAGFFFFIIIGWLLTRK